MSLQDIVPDRGGRAVHPLRDVALDGSGLEDVLAARRRSVTPTRPPIGPTTSARMRAIARVGARPARAQSFLDRLVAIAESRDGWTKAAVPASFRHGPFTYAATTVRLFKDGLTPDASALGRHLLTLWSGEAVAAPPSEEEACAELTRRLALMLATMSEVLDVMGLTSCALDGRTGFSKVFDDLLRDRVAMPPHRFRDFSDGLHLDLRSSTLEQDRIEFAWGDLQIIERRLTLSVLRQEAVGPRLGGRVTVLE